MVHLNAQGLKHTGQILLLPIAGHHRFDHLQQVVDGTESLLLPARHDGGCQPSPIFQFAVELENLGQILFATGVEHLCSGLAPTAVHTHIEGSIEAEGEAPLFGVKMMARHPQIGQNTIHPFRLFMIAHPVGEVAEVAAHKGEAAFVRRHVLFGIGILVKTEQSPFAAQARKYFTAVSTAAESDIDIDAVGLHVEAVDGFAQEHRDMIGGAECGHSGACIGLQRAKVAINLHILSLDRKLFSQRLHQPSQPSVLTNLLSMYFCFPQSECIRLYFHPSTIKPQIAVIIILI